MPNKEESEEVKGVELERKLVKKLVKTRVIRPDFTAEKATGMAAGGHAKQAAGTAAGGLVYGDGDKEEVIDLLVKGVKRLRLMDTEAEEAIENIDKDGEASRVKEKSPDKVKAVRRNKGIEEMTVPELKQALKKRRLKGWSTLNKEDLASLLKSETKQQRLISVFSSGGKEKRGSKALQEAATTKGIPRGEEMKGSKEAGGIGGGGGEDIIRNRRLDADKLGEANILATNTAKDGGKDDGAGVTPRKPRSKGLQEETTTVQMPRTPQRKRRRGGEHSEGG
jgi:hypothetical protein